MNVSPAESCLFIERPGSVSAAVRPRSKSVAGAMTRAGVRTTIRDMVKCGEMGAMWCEVATRASMARLAHAAPFGSVWRRRHHCYAVIAATCRPSIDYPTPNCLNLIPTQLQASLSKPSDPSSSHPRASSGSTASRHMQGLQSQLQYQTLHLPSDPDIAHLSAPYSHHKISTPPLFGPLIVLHTL